MPHKVATIALPPCRLASAEHNKVRTYVLDGPWRPSSCGSAASLLPAPLRATLQSTVLLLEEALSIGGIYKHSAASAGRTTDLVQNYHRLGCWATSTLGLRSAHRWSVIHWYNDHAVRLAGNQSRTHSTRRPKKAWLRNTTALCFSAATCCTAKTGPKAAQNFPSSRHGDCVGLGWRVEHEGRQLPPSAASPSFALAPPPRAAAWERAAADF
jgi:hypothetical protein